MLRQQDERDAAARAAMGGPSSAAPVLLDRDEDGALLIWPENWEAVCAWTRVHDQWLRAGMEGRIVGFDVSAALAIAQAMAAEAATMGHRVLVMELVDKIRFIADEVLGHMLAKAATEAR